MWVRPPPSASPLSGGGVRAARRPRSRHRPGTRPRLPSRTGWGSRRRRCGPASRSSSSAATSNSSRPAPVIEPEENRAVLPLRPALHEDDDHGRPERGTASPRADEPQRPRPRRRAPTARSRPSRATENPLYARRAASRLGPDGEEHRHPHRRRRLPRAQRGHPRRRAAGRRGRLGRRRGARGLARPGRADLRGPRPVAGLGDPAARRHDHRHEPHEPVQSRRRRRARVEELLRPRARRARRDRRRGHARRRGAPPCRAAAPGRRRAEDDRQRPLRHRLHVRLRHRGLDRDRGDRPAAHDGGVAQPRDGRRGDGPPRRLDRGA